MTTLLQARQMMQAGNFNGAREIVYTILRADPNNTDAWQMAVELAPDDNARVQAHQGLQRAVANRPPQQPQYAQPYPQQQQYQQPYMQQPIVINANAPAGYGAMPYRPEKDYMGEAFITLLLYFVGAGIIGLIANVLFLMNASRDRNNGIVTHNVGCLQIMLIVNAAIIALSAIAACLFFFFIPLLALGSGS